LIVDRVHLGDSHDHGVLAKEPMITTKSVMDSLPEEAGGGPAAVLSKFRADLHACLTARAAVTAGCE